MGEIRRELRVLVVDDDESVRLLIAEEFREAHYRVFTAANGPEAIEVLGREPVDALITDYGMPRMNGLELIRWSRARLPHLITVLVTGHDPEAVAPEGWNDRDLPILQKPFSVDHLLLLVGELHQATPTA